MRTRTVAWRAPGRVNLIGEHTDYNDGLALPIAISRGVTAQVTARDDGQLTVSSDAHPDDAVVAAVDDLRAGAVAPWARYAVGAVWAAARAGAAVTGCDVELTSDLPPGAGLASSAAVECAVVSAVAELCHGPSSRESIVDAARAAENDFVGVPTGGLDQNASVHCTAGHALLLDMRSPARRQVPFDLVTMGATLLVVDTRVRHALADGSYAERRRECRQAARMLGVTALREATESDVDALPEPLRRRARHVVTEIARVRRTVDALTSGAPAQTVGEEFTASHESLRDGFEVSCPELDTAVDAALAAGAYGARMTGGGFGGSAIVLVGADAADQVAHRVEAAFADAGFTAPHIFPVDAADGLRAVT